MPRYQLDARLERCPMDQRIAPALSVTIGASAIHVGIGSDRMIVCELSSVKCISSSPSATTYAMNPQYIAIPRNVITLPMARIVRFMIGSVCAASRIGQEDCSPPSTS